MPDVTNDVIAIIAKKVHVESSKLGPNDRLRDVGLASLDAVELIFDLEEKFDIQIPFNANSSQSEFETIGEIVSAIERLIAQKKK
jgi:acyl carrier protein